MSLGRAVRGSIWLYTASIASNFLGYIYWFVAAGFVEASTIGAAAAVVGASSLITGILSLGLPSGTTRMIGRSAGVGDEKSVGAYFLTALALSLSVCTSASLVILIFAGGFMGLGKSETAFVAFLIIAGSGWGGVLSVLFTSTLRTEVNAMASVLSSLSRLGVGILLLYLGMGFVGVMGGYITASLVSNAIYICKCRGLKARRSDRAALKNLLEASMPSYIPSILSVAGTWLGVIGLFGLTGGEETGTYYMAFTMASLVYSIPGTLLGLMFPILSGMEDGRKRATGRAVRFTYAIVAPLAALGLAYPWVPLRLLGESYIGSATALQILLLGAFLAPVTSGFSSLLYAYGRYRLVTIMGLVSNVPRVMLYLPLVAAMGDNGAATSYVSGYIASFLFVLLISRRVGYKIEGKDMLVAASVPIASAITFSILGLHWTFGTAVVAIFSALAYTRLGLIERADIREISEVLLPKKRIDTMQPYIRHIMSILYGEEHDTG